MFIQIIQGRAADPAQLRQSFDLWRQDLASAADGWLGTTAGIAGDDLAIAVIRFDSAEAAERNSARPEQHQWWMDTSKLFWGDVSFHDCRQVMTFLDGGSDQAGFVQIMQGHSPDPKRLWELTERTAPLLREYRPEIIGGTMALHEDGERITQTVYFDSEQAAREGELKEPPPELAERLGDEQELFTGIRYLDLVEPWLYSPQ